MMHYLNLGIETIFINNILLSLFLGMCSFLGCSKNIKTANKTTFYRAIKLFEKKSMVHQIDDGTAFAKYALSDENTNVKLSTGLHMHFHCTDCKKTICLPNKISEESLPNQYEVNDVNLVLKGICKNCSKK